MTSIQAQPSQGVAPGDSSKTDLGRDILDQVPVANLNATSDNLAISYIQNLPDDLLLSIFSLALPNPTPESPESMDIPVQYIMCTICRRWRELALRTPLLWTDIYFPNNEPFETFIFFERSIPALIDVTFSSVSTWFSSEMPLHHQVASAIAAHISRLRSLTLRISGPPELLPIFSAWKELKAPNFKDLSICSFAPQSTIFSRPRMYDAPLRDNASALQTLKLDGIEFRGLPHLPCLIKYETDKMKPSPVDLQTLLARCPALETLVIGRFGAPLDPSTADIQQIEAPSLLTLAINLESDHSSSCGCALPYLSAPNLQCLEISYLSPVLTTHHACILARFKDFPHLERLRIQSNSFWTDGISFLTSLPKSTNLEIIGFPKHVGPILSSILSLKSLQSITLDLHSSNLPPKDHLDAETFREIISTSLSTLSCRITVYCYDNSSAAELEGKYFVTKPTQINPGLLDEYLKRQLLEMLMRNEGYLYEDDDMDDYMDEDDDYENESETFLEQDFAEDMDYSDEEYMRWME